MNRRTRVSYLREFIIISFAGRALKFIGKDKIKDQTMIVELDPNKPAP